MKKYLQETSEGKIILSVYYNNNETLTSVLRSRLVRLIIKGEKDRILSKISVADKLTNFVLVSYINTFYTIILIYIYMYIYVLNIFCFFKT